MIDALYRSLGSLRAWVTFIIGAVAATATWRSPSRANAAAPLGAASSLSHRKHTLPLLALLAAAALGLALLLPGGALQAQSNTIEYAENGEDPVATFTADDPEGATSIGWFIAAAGTAHGSLAIADAADAEDFAIDAEDGELSFAVGTADTAPDYENPSGEGGTTSNTYRVVVGACDVDLDGGACPATGNASYHKIVVEVTNLDETGKIALAATGGVTTGTPQYLVGTTLTATVTDGDITDADQTFTVDRAGEVTGVVWQWYRGGALITGTDARDNTYTLVSDDVGQHIRAVVRYVVTGNVDQDEASETTDYPVLAARVGINQLKFDPATVSRTISEGAKDRNVGAPVTATGNHGTIRYSLDASGDATTGSEKFEIDAKTGQITTAVDLNYESGDGATDNCATANSCTVTVIATDSTGDTTTGTAPNLRATVTITITDVDETPTFSTGEETVGIPENSKVLWHGSTTGYTATTEAEVTYTAADPEGRTVAYSLAGPDASKFRITSDPPVLSFVSGPDFEAKASADRDNVYEVTVRAAVGGDIGERTVRVTVSNVDEGPEISGPSTRSFAENGEDAVATFTATDPEGATSIEWFIAAAGTAHGSLAIADAADAEDFAIDAEDGELSFAVGTADTAPDYENPSGEGATSNTYRVVVGACDVDLDGGACPATGNASYHKVVVEVTNLGETGKIALAATGGVTTGTPQYLVGTTLTATASDGDITNSDQTFTVDRAGIVTGLVWQWYRGGTLITSADAQDNAYTLVDADANSPIRVVARYRVGNNQNLESASETTDYPVLATRIEANALKFDPATVSRTISEGAKDRNVGAPVTATGNHGTIRYSLDASGDATTGSEKFEIDAKTGQITTAVDLNYESGDGATDNCATANSCTVTVIATDSTGDTTTGTAPNLRATVTITITDVNEKPTFSTGEETVGIPENSEVLWHGSTTGYTATTEAEVTYTAADPEGDTVTYSLAGPDASKFQLSAPTTGIGAVLSFVSKPDFEAKASADGDNVYEVTVRASAGGDTGERTVRVTVGNVDEAPTIIASGLLVTGPASEYVEENTPATTAVATYRAAGPDAASARWSLSGADAGDFTITGGVLRFRSVPNFERPADANTDNVYEVTVTANDSTNTAMRDVTVTVTDVEELDPVSGYDANNDGSIDESEVRAAIRDHVINRTITEPVLRLVIRRHFNL